MRIGLQLYTVREAAEADLEGTLRTVAALGYEGVELYSLHGRSAADVRALLDEHGLAVVGRHVPLDADADDLARDAEALGCDRVALAWIEPVDTIEERDASLGQIVGLGERLRSAGLRFGFHNHWSEVPTFDDGKSLLDLLPEWIWLELDLGWVWWAGRSPGELLEWAKGRTPLVHLKDLRARDTREYVPVGEGGVGYGAVIPLAAELGGEWGIVEQDELDRPLADALARSIETVKEAA
ncbi:MAG: sugar phosphate isomerase/epimerase [Actinomycetota bacterium]